MTVTSLLAVDSLYSEETCVAIWRCMASAEPFGTNVDHGFPCLAPGCNRINRSAPSPPTATMVRSA